MILQGYIYGIGYALICLLVSFVLYKLGMPKKYTRKVVHVLVGFEWVILYNYMGAGVHFLAVCVLFLLLLAIAYKGRLMPMISSDADNAPGTVYYALAMTGVAAFGCFVPEVMLPFGIGVMCTSVGDGLAGVVGQLVTKHNPKIYGDKTLLGSIANFTFSALSASIISELFSMELGVWECICIGLLSASLELLTPIGLDNITITWGATALAYSFMYFSLIWAYVAPILATPLIILFAIKKKALTTDGIIAAVVLDIAVSLAFGNRGFAVLCAFFVGAIIVDKIKNKNKKRGREEESLKGDCRDHMQVLANGAAALVASVAFLITKNKIFIIPFVASLAEAFSDTVASGIGSFSRKTYDPFRRCACENGISGGMSLVGTLASLVASVLISYLAYAIGFAGFGIKEFFIVSFSAFCGAAFDSFLGSVFQVKYKCSSCGVITERAEHCGAPTVQHSGLAFIDNDVVNMLSCAFSAILATTLVIFI